MAKDPAQGAADQANAHETRGLIPAANSAKHGLGQRLVATASRLQAARRAADDERQSWPAELEERRKAAWRAYFDYKANYLDARPPKA
jgi:hypothetical protein